MNPYINSRSHGAPSPATCEELRSV